MVDFEATAKKSCVPPRLTLHLCIIYSTVELAAEMFSDPI